jgi:hypothetical protein
MQYIQYKDPNGNFGDDLNAWLWPKIFGYESKDDDNCLIGIGTVLYNKNEFIKQYKSSRKIVFGAGVRNSYDAFLFDNTWDIKFLRGPLSSLHLNNKFDFISDGAYAIRLTEDYKRLRSIEKKYEISFMPYFRSVDQLDWRKICEVLGFHYISPLSENGVEFTLNEIAASKCIITEAMHGAIVADALRVPWHRFVFSTPSFEGEMISEFKWYDWLFSVNINSINTTYIRQNRKTFLNKLFRLCTFNRVDVTFYLPNIIKKEIVTKFSDNPAFYLSDDNIIETIEDKMKIKIDVLRKEFNLTL